ncbi:MAG: hypothetical protein QHH75_04865 [Bacillota bacterium]|nr:hypothetical protein [Bacillota bacterium]
MSGGWLPYHLRRNKAIDRAIFIEFLSRLNAIRPINSYGYIGFGAVRMEDFKLVHSLFDIKNMICIEKDEAVHSRQKFNAPFNCIKLELISSGDFITNFVSDMNYIIWLDYSSPKEIGQQINEIRELLPKLREYDVLKVTLNANPYTLCKEWKYKGDIKALHEKRLNKLIERLNIDYFPQEVDPFMMNEKGYPRVLLNILELTCLDGLAYTEHRFQPVLSFVYKDAAHQMLTLTGIVVRRKISQEECLSQLNLNNWSFANLSWNEYRIIDIPDLTLKERLLIDSLLPCEDLDEVLKNVPVQFNEIEEKSLEQIRNYIKYYRHYPFFSKISI